MKRVLLIIYALLLVLAITDNGYLKARAQLGERPGGMLDDPINSPRDISGLSIKNPRVRIVHTTNPNLSGGSMYLQQADPWLGYQWGRSLTQREFRERDGVYGDNGKLDGLLLPDGATKMMSRSHTNSCAVCHNTPYRDGGAGATIAKNGGEGRNTPHMFGSGLIEMIGAQIRLKALAIADTNRDGWISFAEAKDRRCIISNLPDDVRGERAEIDYGNFDDLNKDGRPDLNPLFNPIYVDKDGQRIAFASNLNFPEVAGYTFETQIYGFGHLYLPFRPPVPTTLRFFIANPFDMHSGLQAYDPTTLNDPDGDGFAQVSNAGALQCLTGVGKDRGAMLGATGISLDDPDRDGYCEEISEGDLDLAEWYLLNHPAPARAQITPEIENGEKLFKQIGCTECHTPDWYLHSANPVATDYTQRYTGDRRFFDLQVKFNEKTARLEGRLISLSDRQGELFIPRRQPFLVQSVYSDFKYHDLGAAFHQVQFDGSVVTKWRTSPLWGVGRSAPYGHDGASLSLDEVIRRHGGEAQISQKAYTALNYRERRLIIEFLESLVLYQTDRLPTDLNGDGQISENYIVAGIDTGYERLNPEWLFKSPARIEGQIKNLQGITVTSYALTNLRSAYGLDLSYLRDSDQDGFPDLIDPAPLQRGYKNGEE